jgi:hypothetical protein
MWYPYRSETSEPLNMAPLASLSKQYIRIADYVFLRDLSVSENMEIRLHDYRIVQSRD